VNEEWAYDVMMKKFRFGNADKPGVYFDEENRRHLNSIRLAMAQVAIALSDSGKKEKARQLLERCDQHMLESNFPYGMPSRRQMHDQITGQFLVAAYKAGDSTLAKKVSAALKKDLQQQISYFNGLSATRQQALTFDNQVVQQLLQQVEVMEQSFARPIDTSRPELLPSVRSGPPINRDTERTDTDH
jgi:spore coat polysaccharide biosynthesis predicted glycosyltransferase SpsG